MFFVVESLHHFPDVHALQVCRDGQQEVVVDPVKCSPLLSVRLQSEMARCEVFRSPASAPKSSLCVRDAVLRLVLRRSLARTRQQEAALQARSPQLPDQSTPWPHVHTKTTQTSAKVSSSREVARQTLPAPQPSSHRGPDALPCSPGGTTSRGHCSWAANQLESQVTHFHLALPASREEDVVCVT